MNSNHLTNNLLTKGWLNISILTKGFILPQFTYIIHVRRGGFDEYAYPLKDGKDLYKDIKKINNSFDEEIDYIEIFINWDKSVKKYNKKIYAELIEKRIEVELINEFKNKYKIEVKLITMD